MRFLLAWQLDFADSCYHLLLALVGFTHRSVFASALYAPASFALGFSILAFTLSHHNISPGILLPIAAKQSSAASSASTASTPPELARMVSPTTRAARDADFDEYV